MHDLTLWIVALVGGYLLGSVPFGYILVRTTSQRDVRDTGSGSTGATNVARAGGNGLAFATLVLDVLKGFLAVYIVQKIAQAHGAFPEGYDAAAIAGLAAVVGHIFPMWLGFRGGKGVATALGVFLALSPFTALLAVVVFALVFALTRYVSLASIVAAVALAYLALWGDGKHRLVVDAVYVAVPLLVIAKHHANIGRLLNRAEPKFGQAAPLRSVQ